VNGPTDHEKPIGKAIAPRTTQRNAPVFENAAITPVDAHNKPSLHRLAGE
jgi:hypothetical protein